MKLIIGLGNPGAKYLKNRHNAGHLFVDFLGKGVKTNVFMNDSGKFVKNKKDFIIAHDDLDIPLGKYKIQFGVGPKVHKGINSIESALGGKDFWRIRIGIDNRPHSAKATRGEDYVLQDFTDEELKILEKVYEKIGHDLKRL